VKESGTPLGIWRLTPRSDVSTQLSGRFVTTQFPLLPFPSRQELEAQLETATERYAIRAAGAEPGPPCPDWRRTQQRFPFQRVADREAAWSRHRRSVTASFQIDLRHQFPDTTVAVLNLSDGTTTYLPKPGFGRDVYQARIAFYKPDALARVTRWRLSRSGNAVKDPARRQHDQRRQQLRRAQRGHGCAIVARPRLERAHDDRSKSRPGCRWY
jgi:hypothetical protein